jgi:hypothetical protein
MHGFVAAQGLAGFTAHGLAVCAAQEFAGAFAAQGLAAAHGFFAFAAHGFAAAQGFAAWEVPKTLAAI